MQNNNSNLSKIFLKKGSGFIFSLIGRMAAFRSRRGVSLYIAIIFVMAFMILSASMVRQMISAKANQERFNKYYVLKYMQQSASEAGEWLAGHALAIGGVQSDSGGVGTSEIRQDIFDRVNNGLIDAARASGVPDDFLAKCADVDGDAGNGLQPCFDIRIVGRGSEDLGGGVVGGGGDNANGGAAGGGLGGPQGANADSGNELGGPNFARGRFDFRYKAKNYSGATALYSVPLKGTGNATLVSGDKIGNSKCVNRNDVNDPCNWNILKYGESVQIPLFYETKDPNHPEAPAVVHTLDMSAINRNRAFFLRMRTPCKEGAPSANADAYTIVHGQSPDINLNDDEAGRNAALKILGAPKKISGTDFPRNCDAADRVELFPSTHDAANFLTFANDPVIVQWGISDENGNTVLAAEGKDDNIKLKRPDFEKLNAYMTNSQLSSGRLNKSLESVGVNIINFINLVAVDGWTDGILRIFAGRENDISSYIDIYDGRRLYFNMKVIQELRRNTVEERYVPHVEYQVLTSDPIADASSKIQVTVRLWDMTATKTVRLPSKNAPNMFVLGNL